MKKYILLKSIILFFFIFIFLTNFNTIHAYNTTVIENFNDNNTQDSEPLYWKEIESGFSQWNVINGEYIGRAQKGSIYPYTLIESVESDDYEISVDVRSVVGVDRHILFRYKHDRKPSRGYAVKYRDGDFPSTPSLVELQKLDQVVLVQVIEPLSKIGDIHNIKISAIDNHIIVYFDGIEKINYTDNDKPNLIGELGFFVEIPGISSLSYTETGYDNLILTYYHDSPLGFDLPFKYEGRGEDVDPETFRNTFWNRLRAVFDHQLDEGTFTNFLGESREVSTHPSYQDHISCPSAEECYDSHNGTDFTASKGEDVLAVDSGTVEYASLQTTELNDNGVLEDTCVPLSGDGFGCVVVVKHNETLYSMYAHLKYVDVTDGQLVTSDTILGKMGNTGCKGKGCLQHLHFAAMQPKLETITSASFLSRTGWESILTAAGKNENNGNKDKDKEIKNPYRKFKPFCNYSAEGATFTFQDSSGWYGNGSDPWENECGTASPLLWKFPVDKEI